MPPDPYNKFDRAIQDVSIYVDDMNPLLPSEPSIDIMMGIGIAAAITTEAPELWIQLVQGTSMPPFDQIQEVITLITTKITE